jgi:hypothetical protein
MHFQSFSLYRLKPIKNKEDIWRSISLLILSSIGLVGMSLGWRKWIVSGSGEVESIGFGGWISGHGV